MDIQGCLNLHREWTEKIERLEESPTWTIDLRGLVEGRAALERDIVAEFHRLQAIEAEQKRSNLASHFGED